MQKFCLGMTAALAMEAPASADEATQAGPLLASLTTDGAPDRMPKPDRLQLAEWCFFTSDQVSGMNRICSYNCSSGGAAMTIKVTQICPAKFRR